MGRGVAMGGAGGPQPRELLPDFFGRAADGRMVYRREFKGRRHLILCFAGGLDDDRYRALLAAIAGHHPAIRAAGAEVVVFRRDGVASGETPCPCVVLDDGDGGMHARYGAATAPLLFVADRYGEVALRRGLDDPSAALDEGLAAVEWMQLRCSL